MLSKAFYFYGVNDYLDRLPSEKRQKNGAKTANRIDCICIQIKSQPLIIG